LVCYMLAGMQPVYNAVLKVKSLVVSSICERVWNVESASVSQFLLRDESLWCQVTIFTTMSCQCILLRLILKIGMLRWYTLLFELSKFELCCLPTSIYCKSSCMI
jgi:hypothetical protein